jgi:hypothetical protein
LSPPQNAGTAKSSPARNRRCLRLWCAPKAGAERDLEARAIDRETRGGDRSETVKTRAGEMRDTPVAAETTTARLVMPMSGHSGRPAA